MEIFKHIPRNTRPVPKRNNKDKGRDEETFLSAESLAKIILLQGKNKKD